MADEVLVERRDRVLLITLNRPDDRNALNHELSELLEQALQELDGDEGLTAGVLTGAGKGFCSGMDLKAFAKQGPSPASAGSCTAARKSR
jgi:enoyl-CoA hydratase